MCTLLTPFGHPFVGTITCTMVHHAFRGCSHIPNTALYGSEQTFGLTTVAQKSLTHSTAIGGVIENSHITALTFSSIPIHLSTHHSTSCMKFGSWLYSHHSITDDWSQMHVNYYFSMMMMMMMMMMLMLMLMMATKFYSGKISLCSVQPQLRLHNGPTEYMRFVTESGSTPGLA